MNKPRSWSLRGLLVIILAGLMVGLAGVGLSAHRISQHNQSLHKLTGQNRAYQQNIPSVDASQALYAPAAPAPGYHIVSASGGTTYVIYYAPAGSNDPELVLSGADASIPKTCVASMTGAPKQDTSGTFYSCNIVLRTPDGTDVYGYRDLSNLKAQGIDPTSVTAQTLRTIQPTKFYALKSNELVTVEFTAIGGGRQNPLTPSVISGLFDSLQPLLGTARSDFISTYIKPPLPEHNSAAEASLDQPYPVKAYVIMVVLCVYFAVFIYALMQLFAKAGRGRWIVFVPVYNLWTMFGIAGLPGWLSLFSLAPAPFSGTGLSWALSFGGTSVAAFGGLLLAALVFYISLILLGLALPKQFGKRQLFGLLLIIPPFPGYILLGLDSSRYGPGNQPVVDTQNQVSPMPQ